MSPPSYGCMFAIVPREKNRSRECPPPLRYQTLLLAWCDAQSWVWSFALSPLPNELNRPERPRSAYLM
jgi:hypothetical protein